jgi:hypothetical protein
VLEFSYMRQKLCIIIHCWKVSGVITKLLHPVQIAWGCQRPWFILSSFSLLHAYVIVRCHSSIRGSACSPRCENDYCIQALVAVMSSHKSGCPPWPTAAQDKLISESSSLQALRECDSRCRQRSTFQALMHCVDGKKRCPEIGFFFSFMRQF